MAKKRKKKFQNKPSISFHFISMASVKMIDAVIRNLIKFIKILPALITLLNILEGTHKRRHTYYTHTHTQVGV